MFSSILVCHSAYYSVNYEDVYISESRFVYDVAHRLKHFARSLSLDEFWVDEPPDIIQDVLIYR